MFFARHKTKSVDAATALPGRAARIATAERHAVNGNR